MKKERGTLMRLILSLLFVFTAVLYGSGTQVVVADSLSGQNIQYAKGEVIIQFNQSIKTDGAKKRTVLNNLLGEKNFTSTAYRSFAAVFVKSNIFSTQELMDRLKKDPSIKAVSPNYIRKLDSATNDPYYSNLWAIENTGQNGGTVNADMDAKEAWDLQTGSKSVVVAVVDTGIDYNHNDLRGNMWDGTAYGIPNHGWDFAGNSSGSNDNDPNPGSDPDLQHGTHVAGTIMAAGVQPAAKGMAFEASLKYFDWNYDTSEMATEAADGMLLSNHSYGFGRGWVWNNGWVWNGQSTAGEDWTFGLYNSNSREFDEIAYSAPYYLIVESAGNDRGDGPGDDPDHPNDGPYDCLADMAVGKNVLTVAAVDDLTGEYTQPSDVQMSYFSSWGPCDDGRIKPDISANGINLYSTYDGSDTDYSSISGTSMAAPSVTGSLALVQEHYQEQTGNFLKAATLKALTVHCADEAGDSYGPDYEFGWGLMNTKRMVDYISADGYTVQINEQILQNGGEYTITLPASGLEDFKATLCWTDPAGTALSSSLDPTTPALINDLDMRITQNGSTYFPWTLDRDNPANAATQNSDNSVDNIEQIVINNPNGSYTITINHKGTVIIRLS